MEKLEVGWEHIGCGAEQQSINKSIDAKTAQEYVQKLKAANILNWKEQYKEPGICDGTHWSIEINTDERSIEKHGDNKFPSEWDFFCSIIKDITEQEFK